MLDNSAFKWVTELLAVAAFLVAGVPIIIFQPSWSPVMLITVLILGPMVLWIPIAIILQEGVIEAAKKYYS